MVETVLGGSIGFSREKHIFCILQNVYSIIWARSRRRRGWRSIFITNSWVLFSHHRNHGRNENLIMHGRNEQIMQNMPNEMKCTKSKISPNHIHLFIHRSFVCPYLHLFTGTHLWLLPKLIWREPVSRTLQLRFFLSFILRLSHSVQWLCAQTMPRTVWCARHFRR